MLKYPLNVTLDTNILYSAKYDFSQDSTLSLLSKYVKRNKIRLVLSDIVIKEAKADVADLASRVCGIARRMRSEVLKVSPESFVNYIGMDRVLELVKDKEKIIAESTKLIDEFIQNTNAEILGTDLIKLDTIIDDYFAINPPFEKGEKKRKEFPDAFIANQIKERFGEDQIVAIVSNDNGFNDACGYTENHIFFKTLGDLYDTISKDEAAYNETINTIKELQLHISSLLLEHIKDNENIDVRGLSYDRDGIEYGYDYDESYLKDVSNISFMIHSVDDISENTSILTLSCKAQISADCYYEDYANAPWDSEDKEYVWVATVHMREEHDARFACRIELDRETKNIKIRPFTIILGGDSRKEVYEIENNQEVDTEQEILDMDRESIGFQPLGSYESYLEEDLPNSDMVKKLIEQFSEVNDLFSDFEEFCIVYDSISEELNKPEADNLVKMLFTRLQDIEGFPNIIDIDNIQDDDVQKVKRWIENRFENASNIAERTTLPDTLDYGESVFIQGINGEGITLTLNEIKICPTEGSEEFIKISLLSEQSVIASGYVKLTVGYLNFDEDGGASDGIEESIEYEYQEISQKLNEFIMAQAEATEKESEIVDVIKRILETK